jgi:predicted ester cyclase
MTDTDNRDRLRCFLEEVSPSGDPEVFAAYVHPDAIMGDGQRVDAYKKQASSVRSGVEFTMKVEDMISEGDKIAARVSIRGTQVGEFMGLPGTGKTFEIEEIMIAQFRDGKISRIWRVADVHSPCSGNSAHSCWRVAGALPSPAPSAAKAKGTTSISDLFGIL